jgi:hypothetical protein
MPRSFRRFADRSVALGRVGCALVCRVARQRRALARRADDDHDRFRAAYHRSGCIRAMVRGAGCRALCRLLFIAGRRPPTQPLSEPILSWGSAGEGDLIYVEHDGQGRARIGIDHWGAAGVFSKWTDATLLGGHPWEVNVSPLGITVRAPGATVKSDHTPFDLSSPHDVGKNAGGFTSAAKQAASQVVVRKE